MGSGCSSNCPTYFKQTTPDSAIIYTGPAIPELGICTGDTLSEVESVLLQKIIDYSTGVGINIPDIDLTACDLFVDFVTCCSTCTDLNCLMKVVFTSLCTLNDDISTIKAAVDALLNGPYNVSCLTGLGSNPKLNAIVQELIIEFCALKTQVASLASAIASLTSGLPTTIGNFLASALSSCQGSGGLTKSGSGASFTASFKGFNLVGTLTPYAGPTAGLFDSTGLGMANTPACGWALANGNNGTINMVEQVPVGAGIGAMGGTTPSNASGANYSIFSKFGEAYHTLNSGEIPSVGVIGSVTVNDPGHDHALEYANRVNGRITSGGANNYVDLTGVGDHTSWTARPSGTHNSASSAANIGYIQSNYTGITISTSGLQTGGGGAKHNNVQPSTALLYIQRIN